MVKDPRTGKGKMLRALLDSGCTKSIILKSFTSPKERKQLSKKTVAVMKHMEVILHLIQLQMWHLE